MSEKCIVFGCENKKYEGAFVGDICLPCYHIITEGDIQQPSTNFIHKLADKIQQKDKLLEELYNIFYRDWDQNKFNEAREKAFKEEE